MSYEVITGQILMCMSVIFTILAVLLKNKTLKFLFLMVLMPSITLTVNYGKAILENNGVTGDLITLMDAGIFLATWTTVAVVTYFIIYLIMYVVNKLNRATGQKSGVAVEEGIEGL